MKLMITVPWAERLGGAENMLYAWLRNIDQQQVSVTVVLLKSGSLTAELSALGIETRELPAGRLRDGRKFIQVVRMLRRWLLADEPDLLLNWTSKSHLYGGSAARLAGMSDRVIWWQHGISTGDWLDRLASLIPARAVGCSSITAATAQRQLWPKRPTFVVNPGIIPPAVSAVHPPTELRSKHPGEMLVGIAGRLQPWKGQHRFLRALALARTAGANVHGVLIGGNAYNLSPGYEAALHSLVQQIGLEGHVTFTGQVDDAVPFISQMDILVNASQGEPFGIVLLEAMATGTPLIAYNTAGPAEILRNDETGILVPMLDDGVLADAIKRLSADADLRERLRSAALSEFAAKYTAERMAREMEVRLGAALQM